jgi:two-component sensor histidine kinase
LLAWYFFIAPAENFALSSGSIVALLFYVAVVSVDIALVHAMQVANRRLRQERERSASLAERMNLLFRELQHRVGNNIAMVASLLSLQERRVKDPEAGKALSDAAMRMAMLGNIHRKLYDPSGQLVPLDRFLGDITRQLVDSSGRSDIEFRFEADDSVLLQPDAAIPVALIVAEAMANAMEHGLPSAEGGTIVTRLCREGDGVVITVSDNGRGLPEDFDLAGVDSLGLTVTRSLCRQLDSAITLERENPGTTLRLTMPARHIRLA